MKEWLNIALQPSVIRRALKYALIVGAILISINYGDAILHGEIESRHLLKMGLTVMVPYLVSTFSSVGAIRTLRNSTGDPTRKHSE